MNPHLGHLLSRVFDGTLAPEHLADLRKSGLTDETIASQFFRSVPPAMIPRLVGFECPSARSMMLMPFRSPAGGFMDLVRVKVFPPLSDAEGHTIKYVQPRGSAPRLYFVVRCLPPVLESDVPLWLVEGEKKALAVAQLGLPAVGFAGVEGWHRGGDDRLLPDFDTIRLEGRVVELLPDGDYQTNVNVERAIRRFAAALRGRGAKPGVRLLPRQLPRR
ncbi:MAG: DUF3854 domain-containing protein [Candidatus Rokuibacteriota bacterium]